MAWYDTVMDVLSGSGAGSEQGLDWTKLLVSVGGGLALGNSSFNQAQTPPTGYQGGIPEYEAVRSPVPVTVPENYRPGSAGRRYFSDTRYTAPSNAAAQREAANTQAAGIATLNNTSPFIETRPPATAPAPTTPTRSPIVSQAPATVIQQMPIPQRTGLSGFTSQYAEGGIARLAKGRYLNGESDGMADQVRANIDGRQEARLSDGEYVIPADVVSHLGNGNSGAGAKVLDEMLSRVRKQRTGNEKQGKEIDPRKVMPS